MTNQATLPPDVAKFLANESIIDYAVQASRRCGVFPSVILAQWGVETAWGTSEAWVDGHNFAGVSRNGVVLSYPTYEAGLSSYETVLLLAIYNPVRRAHSRGPNEQAIALGESPWAASHYEAQGSDEPGSLLVQVIADFDLARFDELDVSKQAPPAEKPPAPFAQLDSATAHRLVLDAYRLVLNRSPSGAESSQWVMALMAGTEEIAHLVELLTAEPQSFVSPMVPRDASV